MVSYWITRGMNPIYLDIGREFHLWNDGKIAINPASRYRFFVLYFIHSFFLFFFFAFTLSSCNNIYLTTNPSFNVAQIRLYTRFFLVILLGFIRFFASARTKWGTNRIITSSVDSFSFFSFFFRLIYTQQVIFKQSNILRIYEVNINSFVDLP